MINLIKKKGSNPQDKSVLYFPQWTRVQTTDAKELAKRMARGSTFSVGEISGMFQDFPDNIIDELLAGNAVQIDGLGSFKLKVSGKSKPTAEEVTSQGATIQVVFEPAAELTSRLNNEKQFQFVAVPTAEGQQDAESSEAGTGTGTGTGNTGTITDTTGDNTGDSTGDSTGTGDNGGGSDDNPIGNED